MGTNLNKVVNICCNFLLIVVKTPFAALVFKQLAPKSHKNLAYTNEIII